MKTPVIPPTLITLCVALLAAACAPVGGESEDDVGTASAAITAVPTDVTCVAITVTGGRAVTRRFDVHPGESATLALSGLPLGDVRFVGSAYAGACSTITDASVSLWESPPVPAFLVAGISTAVTLPLYRSPHSDVTVDFRDGAGTPCDGPTRGDCDGDRYNGCETDLATSSVHCGACGNVCPGGTACSAARCVPVNDTCAGATPIEFATAQEFWVPFRTANAGRELAAPCGANVTQDVFFTFTLTRPELVYADTFPLSIVTSAVVPPVLYFAQRPSPDAACAPFVPASADATGLECNAGTPAIRGTIVGSRVVARLGPGTWYLVVAGTQAQGDTLHVQHLPAGSGTPTRLAFDENEYVASCQTFSVSGTTSGANTATSSCGSATGPEHVYWWLTPPSDSYWDYHYGWYSTLRADTCGFHGFDTVVYNAGVQDAGGVCNDDAGGACGTGSALVSRYYNVPGIHEVVVDGYAGSSGAFQLNVSMNCD